ncbi:MAG TPA: hypothetical protein VFV17_09835, partial [Usitatibacteraceae bacterium]|nr:hypothetical protein [Usitatibacteraceae bacterium]
MSGALGLGIDAGGTTTRWALAQEGGIVVAEGAAAGMTGVQLLSDHGRAALGEALAGLGAEVLRHGHPVAVCAGFTGLDQRADDLAAMIASVLGVQASAV